MDTAALALIILAVPVAAWGLFADAVRQRRRARRRCPRCWYDLSVTTSRQCSECGYTARSERRLLKPRRRWGLVILAVLLATGGWSLRNWTDLRDRGWPAAVPTTAIIVALPAIEANSIRMWINGVMNEAPTVDDLLFEELARRVSADEPWTWQRRLLVHRCVAGDDERPPGSLPWSMVYGRLLQLVGDRDRDAAWWPEETMTLAHVEIITRDRWLAGTPIHAQVHPTRWGRYRHEIRATPRTPGLRPFAWSFGSRVTPRSGSWRWASRYWHDGARDVLGTLEHGVTRIEFDISIDGRDAEGASARRTEVLSLPITICDRIEEILEPVPSPAFVTTMQASVTASMRRPDSGEDEIILALRDEVAWPAGVTVALRLEVRRNDEVFATGSIMTEAAGARFLGPGGQRPIPIARTRPPLADVVDEPVVWRLRLIGDPIVALRDFASNRCWIGVIELPLDVPVDRN